jgi:signal transduction histidine kinase
MPVERVWSEWAGVVKELDSGTGRTREVSFGAGAGKKVYEMQSSFLSGVTSERSNLLITMRDITERKLVDERLREAERLAAIGETATMVGHDLRNPLQGISGAVYILKQKWSSTGDQETMEMLELVESSLGYADNIVRDLMDYSREVLLEPTETTAKAVIEAALLQVKIPENVTVRDLTQDTPRVILDAAKTQRVIVNLLKNAIDAMPKGGQITLSSSESNGILEVTVTDTGEGISESAMQNLWKPFKTTKQKGTGLGLAICKRIVEAHGGAIQVETTEGKGSTFTIAIPISRSATKPQPKPENEAVNSPILIHAPNPTRNNTS